MDVKSSKLEVKKATAKAATARLFFLSASSGEVFSANPDGSDLKIIVSEGRRIPDGIIVDVEAGHLYWTNMGNPSANDGSIERANLDGSNVTHIVPPGGTFTPKQLQLDEKNRKLYWSDREGMRVMRANLDGSKVESLIDTSGGDARPGKEIKKWCVGIALDVEGGKVYWTQKGPANAGEGRIFRANLEIPKGQTPANRKDVELLYENLPEPIRPRTRPRQPDALLDGPRRSTTRQHRESRPCGSLSKKWQEGTGDCFRPFGGRNRYRPGSERRPHVSDRLGWIRL
jgi:DNA-binding beta-propeller fold protein YncE